MLKDLGCFCCLVIIGHMRCSNCLRLCFFVTWSFCEAGTNPEAGSQWTGSQHLNLITSASLFPGSSLMKRESNPHHHIKHTLLSHTHGGLCPSRPPLSAVQLCPQSQARWLNQMRTQRTAWPTCFTSIRHTPTVIFLYLFCYSFLLIVQWGSRNKPHLLLKFFKK